MRQLPHDSKHNDFAVLFFSLYEMLKDSNDRVTVDLYQRRHRKGFSLASINYLRESWFAFDGSMGSEMSLSKPYVGNDFERSCISQTHEVLGWRQWLPHKFL